MADNLLTPKEEYKEETLDTALKRYSGFGKDVYQLLEKKLPHIFLILKFYQRTTYQKEDSYAVYLDPDNPEKSFAIQLDPLIEVIVLWNHKTHVEIGTWADNPEKEAVEYISDIFMSTSP